MLLLTLSSYYTNVIKEISAENMDKVQHIYMIISLPMYMYNTHRISMSNIY